MNRRREEAMIRGRGIEARDALREQISACRSLLESPEERHTGLTMIRSDGTATPQAGDWDGGW